MPITAFRPSGKAVYFKSVLVMDDSGDAAGRANPEN
jgi:hypothetical protein